MLYKSNTARQHHDTNTITDRVVTRDFNISREVGTRIIRVRVRDRRSCNQADTRADTPGVRAGFDN